MKHKFSVVVVGGKERSTRQDAGMSPTSHHSLLPCCSLHHCVARGALATYYNYLLSDVGQ